MNVEANPATSAGANIQDSEQGGGNGGSTSAAATRSSTIDASSYHGPEIRRLLLTVVCIYITLSTYFPMVLTNWATLQSSDAMLSNPKTGTVALWLQAAGQWIVLLLYCWTLVAPSLFPDRDFS